MYNKYVIKKEDTTEILERKFNSNIEQIKDINNIAYNNSFKEGMEIIVPKKEPYYDYLKCDRGDTIIGLANRYNIHPELLANINGLEINDYVYKNQSILIPRGGYSFYITKEGDTLDTTADLFNTNKEEIFKTNETIYLLPGQLLANKIK